jgi:hypothetical protein
MARTAAAVMLSQGVQVHLFGDLVPTPFVAFAVELLGCAGGVMVTASHNPKEYNGYKVRTPHTTPPRIIRRRTPNYLHIAVTSLASLFFFLCNFWSHKNALNCVPVHFPLHSF